MKLSAIVFLSILLAGCAVVPVAPYDIADPYYAPPLYGYYGYDFSGPRYYNYDYYVPPLYGYYNGYGFYGYRHHGYYGGGGYRHPGGYYGRGPRHPGGGGPRGPGGPGPRR